AQSLKILPPGGSLAYDLTQSNEKPIVFSCTPPDHASANTLGWFDKNDRPLTSAFGRVVVYTSGMSKILQISRPGDSDGGTYTCKGTVEGQETEASILLELYKGISNTSPLQQYPVQGTDAKIMCNVSSSMSFTVKWFTGDLLPIQTGDKFLQMTDHLLVKNIQLNDSGHYFCQCMIPNLGITQGYNISVNVTIPPKMDGRITQHPPTPKEGDDLELICIAEGTPAPSYMYYKGNVPVNDEPSTNGRLRLEKVTRDQEGIYTCVATNKGGEDRQDVRVDIRIPPKIDPIQNISMEANRECIMQCVAKGDPKPNLFWRRKDRQDYYTENPTEGEEIRVEEYSQTDDENEFTSITTTTLKLIIPNLKPEHSAEYVCKAENEAGMEEKAGRIDVQYAPNFSDQANAGTAFYGWIGGSTNLTCVANGNPEPVISWWYNNQEVQQGTDYTVIAGNSGVPTKAISYLIPSVRADTVDNVFGSYICRAVNKLNPSGKEQTLEFKQAMSNDEIITQTSVRDLEANTSYIIEVSAKSKVGLGIAEQIQGTTATVTPMGDGPQGPKHDQTENGAPSPATIVGAAAGILVVIGFVVFVVIFMQKKRGGSTYERPLPRRQEDITVYQGIIPRQLRQLPDVQTNRNSENYEVVDATPMQVLAANPRGVRPPSPPPASPPEDSDGYLEPNPRPPPRF
ncbi:hypothetical protein BaRGS_00035669, partial [Batillaria attramentaria]